MLCANIYGPLDWGMPYYNFAAGSFHTKTLCSRLYLIKLHFSKKYKYRFLSHPLGDLGVTYALHL